MPTHTTKGKIKAEKKLATNTENGDTPNAMLNIKTNDWKQANQALLTCMLALNQRGILLRELDRAARRRGERYGYWARQRQECARAHYWAATHWVRPETIEAPCNPNTCPHYGDCPDCPNT
jgi:hypothetical protein